MPKTITQKIQSLGGTDRDKPELISYKTLRRAIGWLGILLPVILFIGGCLFAAEMKLEVQPSISHYYFTNMREIFVGTLCAVAMFLFCYKGNNKQDSRAANLAGIFALLTALFPTDIIELSKVGNTATYYHGQAELVSFITVSFHDTIHFTCATLFFLTLAYMSLFLFTKSKGYMTREKRRRNRIYKTCAWTMIGSILGIAAYFIGVHFKVFDDSTHRPVVYVFEFIALIAFGISWLTKGEVIEADAASKHQNKAYGQ